MVPLLSRASTGREGALRSLTMGLVSYIYAHAHIFPSLLAPLVYVIINALQGISVFAPGEDTLSTWIGSDTATHVTNGTSMASPHVAGVVLYLQKLEGLSTPDEVRARIEELAIKDVVQDAQNSPNRLLYTGAA